MFIKLYLIEPKQTTSLTSSRTQSSNTSPVLTNSPPCGGVVATFSSEGGAFTKLTQKTVPLTPPEVKKEELGKSKLAEKEMTKCGCNSGGKRHGITNWAHLNNLHPLLDTKVEDFILRL